MNSSCISMRSLCLAFALAIATAPVLLSSTADASEIKYVVDGTAVTTYDIDRRAAFLKLQKRPGNLRQLAAEEMIDQAVRTAEIKRQNVRISDDAVEDAYVRFAKSNKLTLAQLDGIMAESGVTKSHFKDFIRTQMGWTQALGARGRPSGGGSSEQEAVKRMLKQGGAKPKATEYLLQQVIFVVPAGERGARLGARKREAEAMRDRFAACETTRQFAKGLVDVTVRDLGRVLELALPPEWAESIKNTKPGDATQVKETERGVEFIGICSSREVSDDRVAQMVFRDDDGGENGADADAVSKKYTAELRAKAKIVER